MLRLSTISGKVDKFQVPDKFRKEKPLTPTVRTRNWFLRTCKEFCETTSLHGYNHIVREDFSIWERAFWAFAVFVALVSAITLLIISWNWSSEQPTVTVIESTHYATWNVPFPSFTICPINKLSKKLALEKAEKMSRPDNMTSEYLAKMFVLMYSFENTGEDKSDAVYLALHKILDANNEKVGDLVEALSPNCVDILERCIWKGTQTRCDSLFQRINTAKGPCCSFNYYGLRTNRYPAKIAHSIPKRPRRVTACGFQTGLSVLARTHSSDYFGAFFSTYGFRLLLGNAYDYQDENAETKFVNTELEALINVSPESTYSTQAVRRLPVHERNCLFQDERKLNVMQKYTYTNCMAECRSSLMYTACGCIPHSLPNNGSVPTCEMNKMACILKYKAYVSGAIPGINQTMTKLVNLDDSPCDCLPDCELVQYPSEISSGTLNRDYSYNSLSFFKGVNTSDTCLIHVFFSDLVSTHYRKDVNQNWLEVLASFGGLLGLLLGFSFVTGFEIFYFFTLGPIVSFITKKCKRL